VLIGVSPAADTDDSSIAHEVERRDTQSQVLMNSGFEIQIEARGVQSKVPERTGNPAFQRELSDRTIEIESMRVEVPLHKI
jgi:hypothetical protein